MSKQNLSLMMKTRQKMMTTSVWNLLKLIKKTKKTIPILKRIQMFLEQLLLKSKHLLMDLMKHQRILDLEMPQSIHSREEGEEEKEEKNSQKKSPEREEEDMDSENSDDNEVNMGTMRSKRTSYVCFKNLMYYNRYLDRYYYFRYFKPYMFDHRLLTMGHDCRMSNEKTSQNKLFLL